MNVNEVQDKKVLENNLALIDSTHRWVGLLVLPAALVPFVSALIGWRIVGGLVFLVELVISGAFVLFLIVVLGHDGILRNQINKRLKELNHGSGS